MSHAFTDEHGMPLTAHTALRYLNASRNKSRRPPPKHAVYCGEPSVSLQEPDEGFMGAIRLSPRLVGTAPGQVPPATAARLVAAGCVRLI